MLPIFFSEGYGISLCFGSIDNCQYIKYNSDCRYQNESMTYKKDNLIDLFTNSDSDYFRFIDASGYVNLHIFIPPKTVLITDEENYETIQAKSFFTAKLNPKIALTNSHVEIWLEDAIKK